ncbi:hypothetical protein AADEFJLK_03586 [Methylovulum psychrotolerans]|uniref:Uncharacterized protein n=1 Tax=Methylovulum psychrotolerans TaxID=1704499 RepID=A0A2S5CIS0_9GAMM|nr:hypothetical protein AADEFJLK_03586 [Methylovulum psychrotolerans]
MLAFRRQPIITCRWIRPTCWRWWTRATKAVRRGGFSLTQKTSFGSNCWFESAKRDRKHRRRIRRRLFRCPPTGCRFCWRFWLGLGFFGGFPFPVMGRKKGRVAVVYCFRFARWRLFARPDGEGFGFLIFLMALVSRKNALHPSPILAMDKGVNALG